MGGSIHYKDGRKLADWYIRYEIVYLPVRFSPDPKPHKPRWSVW